MHFHSLQIIVMDNNIQFIDQRIAHLWSLIPICKARSTAAEKRMADTIITLEIKHIKAMGVLENRLGQLRAHIPVFKARCPTYVHVLAKQINSLDLQLIATKTKQFPTHPPAPQLFAPNPPATLSPPSLSLEQHPPVPQPVQINDIARILTERPRMIPNLYWQPGQPIGVPVSHFRQIKYLPLPNSVPYLEQALSEARLECARDLHKQLFEFGGAAKVWMTVLVKYETVILMANKQPFIQYLNHAPTRIFMREKTISAFSNPYIDYFKILTD